MIKSEQKNLKTLQKIKEKLKTSMNKDPQENRYNTHARKILTYVKNHFNINSDSYYHSNEIQINYNTELLRQLKALFNQSRSSKSSKMLI